MESLLAINIGPREQRKRSVMGFAALMAGVCLAFALVVMNAPRWSRVSLFFPIWIAALGLFQAREKTCIAMAARGMRNMDEGEETVEDRDEAEGLRMNARRINMRAFVIAIVVTLVALAFPE
ncbi:MAG TPA: hypothetical protein VK619_14670 [Pyrinomonadaceae bacterium]|nr:hypothetical protein [Pyrinomonadaceae bacterium]